MLNNFSTLKKFLHFEEGKFYYLQLLARKKDNPNQSRHVKVVRDYFIDSEEYYDAIRPQVIELCETFNARAYLRLNRRSYKKVTFHMLKSLAIAIEQEQWNVSKSSFATACGQTSDETSETKKWIVDVDDVDWNDPSTQNYIDSIHDTIQSLQSEVTNKSYKIYGNVYTKNGLHIITNPFNVKEFKKSFSELDVHKDNPVNLYIP